MILAMKVSSCDVVFFSDVPMSNLEIVGFGWEGILPSQQLGFASFDPP